jgi:hypothetical protein
MILLGNAQKLTKIADPVPKLGVSSIAENYIFEEDIFIKCSIRRLFKRQRKEQFLYHAV